MPNDTDLFRCYWVERDSAGGVHGRITQRALKELPDGDVLIRVACSSLNYKDALAAAGHQGVNRLYPHIPGVDAAGVVVESGVYEFVPGDEVLVTGFQMGANRWGGFAEYVRVPAEWVVPRPDGLTLQECMMLGTAGLTAGLAIDVLQKFVPAGSEGPIVVSGASGGVGSMAVAILAKLGYQVSAVTGKPLAADFLRSLGAKEILPREAVDDMGGRPLLSSHWAGGVDTVGGNVLASILRATRHSGCVAACGMTAGTELAMTVYPFILRGVTLAGVDAALCPLLRRHSLWWRLAGAWKPERLADMVRIIELDEVGTCIDDMLASHVIGRYVIRLNATAELS
jgi:putative YhdH/YhfP family quinone oxidoreductase